jgi:hypothetical protein
MWYGALEHITFEELVEGRERGTGIESLHTYKEKKKKKRKKRWHIVFAHLRLHSKKTLIYLEIRSITQAFLIYVVFRGLRGAEQFENKRSQKETQCPSNKMRSGDAGYAIIELRENPVACFWDPNNGLDADKNPSKE